MFGSQFILKAGNHEIDRSMLVELKREKQEAVRTQRLARVSPWACWLKHDVTEFQPRPAPKRLSPEVVFPAFKISFASATSVVRNPFLDVSSAHILNRVNGSDSGHP